MPQFDLPLEELRRYRPDVAVPDDLDDFWHGTLAAAREHELNAEFTRGDTGLVVVETYDVTFAGYGGTPGQGALPPPPPPPQRPAARAGHAPARRGPGP